MKRTRLSLGGAIVVLYGLGLWHYHSRSIGNLIRLAVIVLLLVFSLALVVWIWRRGQRFLSVVLVAVLLIVAGNFTFLPYELGLEELSLFEGHSYVSSDGGFYGGGRNCLKTNDCTWTGVERNFTEYAESHPGVRLLRQEAIHPWKFWNWFDYATDPGWRLAYAGS